MIAFSKYEGAGNDFILIDDRDRRFPTSTPLVKAMCDRHFGIGADGLMLLQLEEHMDFKMVYYNSDGNLSSMCGNGGRCITRFAADLNIIQTEASFAAVDGMHKAVIHADDSVSLQMSDVNAFEHLDDDTILINTGSPHLVKRIHTLEGLDLVKAAHIIRYSERFAKEGINVNFVEVGKGYVKIRTYERGVEDETLACGTGVTAAAIAASVWGDTSTSIDVEAVGGDLKVTFDRIDHRFKNIWKTGPATFVFKGKYMP